MKILFLIKMLTYLQRYVVTKSCFCYHDFQKTLCIYELNEPGKILLLQPKFTRNIQVLVKRMNYQRYFSKVRNELKRAKTQLVRGIISPPLFQINPPFLEIQDVPTFHRFIGKTKVLNNSCNQFVVISTLKVSQFWNNVYKSGEIQT